MTVEVERGTQGVPPLELFEILDQLDSAYRRQDKVGFIELKAQLAKHPWCAKSLPSSSSSPIPTVGKSAAMPPASESPTLWDALAVDSLE